MMGMGRQPTSSLWLALIWPALSFAALTFTNTNPTSCDPLTVSWQGGQPPFRLLMIAPNYPIYNFSIPSTSFSNNAGSFTIPQLMLPNGGRVMFAMSDATGVSVGGLTSLQAVGSSVSNVPCNTTGANPDFFYSTDPELVECQPYTFSLYQNATQPITIFGFIPNGPLLTLFPPLGDHFDWITNFTAGTTMLFYMEDALGRDGGISEISVVQLSNDTSCLLSNGTNSTGSSSSQGSPPTSTGTSGGTGASPSPKSSNVAVIAGAAAGGGAVVVLLGFLVGFCLWRRRRSSSSRVPIVRKGSSKEAVDLLDGMDGHNLPDVTLSNYVVEPFVVDASSSTPSLTATGTLIGTGMGMGTGGASSHLGPLSRKEQMRMAIMNETSGASASAQAYAGHTHSRVNSGVQLLSEFGAGTTEYTAAGGGMSRYSTAQTSAGTSFAQSGSGSGYGSSFYTASHPSHDGLLSPGVHSSLGERSPNARTTFSSTAPRVIVHTDIAEGPMMDDEQPVELPPMYSEGRRPIPGLLASDIPATTAATTPRSRKGP